MTAADNNYEPDQRIAKLQEKLESLRKEKEDYRILFDSLLFGVQEIDTKGTIVYANEANHRIHGYENGELAGRSILDFYKSEADRHKLAQYLEYLVQEQPEPAPWFNKDTKKDGSPVDVRIDWNYKRDETGRVVGFISLISDISEKKKIQQALQENQSKFQAIFNSISDAIVFVDQQRCIVMANKAFSDIFGYELGEVIGRTTQFFYADPDDYLDQGKKRYHVGARADSPVYEMNYRRKDGTVFPGETLGVEVKDENGTSIGFLGIMRDISERKKAELALKNSEEKFQLLMDSLDAMVYVADMDTYEILFINKYGKELFGEVTGQICWQIFQAGQSGPCVFCTNKYLVDSQGKPCVPHMWDFQNTFTKRWFHIIDRAIKWTDGRIVRLEIATDITDLKKAEKDLRESEEKYSTIFHNEIDAIVIFDGKTQKLVDANQAFLDLYGYTREEAHHLQAVDISAEPEQTIATIKKTAREGNLRIRRRRHRKKDGTEIVVDIGAVPIMLQGRKVIFSRIQDITEHVEAEKELHELEERFRIAFHTSPDSININKLDGTYVEINEGFTALTGYTREDVIGKSSLGINIWDNNEDRKTLLEGLQQSGRMTNLEANFRMKDGSIKTGLMSANIIYLYGEPHILSITKDITDRKNAEKEKAKLEAQLRQVYKMEAIGTMAGGIAHDFNNILTIILGNADLAKFVGKEDSQSRPYLDQILEASARAKEMVRQILAFSRQAKQDLVPVKPHMVFSETLKLLRATIPTSVEIRQVLDPKCRTINADPTQLNQVLMNLCANAVHAMDEKGTLTVSLQEKELHKEQTVHKKGMKPGHYAMLSVTDTGKGMSAEVQERIFDPFFTTKKVGEGTGMGLSVVHGIIESHGGMIAVDSIPGQGTTFKVFFPIVDEAAELITSIGPMQFHGNEHILFVDDEESLVELAVEMLHLYGYKVTSSTSSREALETFSKAPDSFDLVITDQTMPHMTGAELAAALLKIKPGLPIILCTGYSSKVSDELIKEIGIAAYFLKPFDTQQLVRSVREVLETRK